MTVICAMHEAGVGTWIASDTWQTSEGTFVGHAQKWTPVEGGAIASCGTTVARNIIREHRSEIRADWTSIQLFRWIKPLLDAHGFKPRAEDGEPPYYGCQFLLATPRGVVSSGGDGGGTDHGDRSFASRGSGAYIADGAAWALLRRGASPCEIVSEAVTAAIAHGSGCGGDLWIDCLRL